MNTIDENNPTEQDQPASQPRVVTNKAGMTYVVDGEAYKLLPNGAVRGTAEGRVVAIADDGYRITQENSRDIRAKLFERKLSAQLAAGRGLALATGSAEELAAVEALTAKMGELAMDTSRGRVAVEAYRAGMAAAGFMGVDQRRDNDGGQPAGLRLDLSPAAVDGLLALVAAWRGAAGSGEDGEEE